MNITFSRYIYTLIYPSFKYFSLTSSYRLKCHKRFEKCSKFIKKFSYHQRNYKNVHIFKTEVYIFRIIHHSWRSLNAAHRPFCMYDMSPHATKTLAIAKMPLLSDVLKFLINMHLMKSFPLVMSWKQMPCVVWRYIYRGSPAELVFPFLPSRRYCSSVLCQEKGWRSRDINI